MNRNLKNYCMLVMERIQEMVDCFHYFSYYRMNNFHCRFITLLELVKIGVEIAIAEKKT